MLTQPGFRLAVLGDPVEHSLSPPMQNAALSAASCPIVTIGFSFAG